MYFTDLKVFSQAELQLQMNGLTSLLATTLKIASQQHIDTLEEDLKYVSKPLCVSKNRRRTIRRQLDKIQRVLQSSSVVVTDYINPNDRVGTGFWKQ